MEELWKDIVGYEGKYKISSFGRIKSLERSRGANKGGSYVQKEKFLTPIRKTTGYIQHSLCKNGHCHPVLLHRVVATAFISNPTGKPQVNHLDGNRSNNHVGNLEWCTPSENSLHAYRVLGREVWSKGIFGKDAPRTRAVKQKTLCGSLVKIWYCISDAVRAHGFDSGSITRVCQGKANKHKGFKWEYHEE